MGKIPFSAPVCPMKRVLELIIFIFKIQILHDDFRMTQRVLSKYSESTQNPLREYLKSTQREIREKEINQTSSYRRSLKYFVLLRAKWLGKVVHTIEKVFPSFPTSVRKTPLSSQTPAPDFMERGYLYRENYIFRARCLAIS